MFYKKTGGSLTCGQASEHFEKLMLEELTEEQQNLIQDHLLLCEPCMTAYRRFLSRAFDEERIPWPDVIPEPPAILVRQRDGAPAGEPDPGMSYSEAVARVGTPSAPEPSESTAPPFPILTTLARHIKEIDDLAKKQVGSFWRLLETNLDQTAAALERSFNEAIGFVPQHLGAERPVRASGETPEDEIAKAIHRLVQEKQLPPNITEGARALANALGELDSEKLDSASKLLNELLRKQESLELRLMLAYCYKKQGHHQRAETQIKQALELARAGK
ncbi:MAG: tetratricopeptide repeat protein [bacterium]